MEIWDILDNDGKKTGKTVPGGSRLQQGEYHQTVHVWISDQNGEILIQKRASHVNWMPGLWGIASGSAIHGEDSLNAVIRHIAKDLGLFIDRNNLQKIQQIKITDEFIDIWSVCGKREDFIPVILSNNVADICWASWNALLEMVNRSEFVKYDYLDIISNFFSQMPVDVSDNFSNNT